MHHSKKLYITRIARDVQFFFRDAFHVHPSKTVCNGVVHYINPVLYLQRKRR